MAMIRPSILVADDQADVREALRLLLKSLALDCTCVDGPKAALAAAQAQRFDAALIDLNYTRDTTSGAEGLELLHALKALDAQLPVVVMTAWGTIDLAVEAMRRGAGDFVEKPWDNLRLSNIIHTQLALGAAHRNESRLAAENALLRVSEEDGFIATSPAMQKLMTMVQRVAQADANVLILGENGTGKSLLARKLHELSARADKPFVKVNMGGIPETMFEAEMFGHVKGAFTDAKADRMGRFELADGGTLFLDEIANIPPSQQPKLLRVLEDGELERLGSSRTLKLDVRIVSATNAELAREVAEGRFRQDLLFRLNTVELQLPPLRERGPDIELMAERFLARFARRYQRDGMRFTAAARAALAAYPWPGNVRELAHVIERAALLSEHEALDAEVLNLATPAQPISGAADLASSAALTVEQAEERMVREALARSGGNIRQAARELGLSRPALYRRLAKYGIGNPG